MGQEPGTASAALFFEDSRPPRSMSALCYQAMRIYSRKFRRHWTSLVIALRCGQPLLWVLVAFLWPVPLQHLELLSQSGRLWGASPGWPG